MQPVLVKPGLFRDRREAGRLLAEKLAAYANRPDVLVLALPRGGVPVAYEVARGLVAPLDVFVVRKLGVPGYEELAMGAIATGGVCVLNDQLVEHLGIPEQTMEAVAAREREELERRERLYRGHRPPPSVRGRTVILVDDGLATGATMHAAIEALRLQNPARIVVAVPTASPETCEEMKEKADDVICAITPEPFYAVGGWYQGFSGQLIALQRRAADTMLRDGGLADDDLFYAEQNARLVKNAEAYYRSVFREEVSSWNLRDRHMAETLEALVVYLGRKVGRVKVALWEHNSHLGDARATEMGQRGELNVGQLTREKYGGEAVLIGFTTHHGTVTAASDWGKSAERKRVRPALAGSYEALFHAVRHDRFLLIQNDSDLMVQQLAAPRLERAIGVIYRPETERQSHYFGTRLVEQFAAVLHFDKTRAVKPLECTEEWETGELPETFPFAV
jgi:predicted phosphoribosyltransferase